MSPLDKKQKKDADKADSVDRNLLNFQHGSQRLAILVCAFFLLHPFGNQIPFKPRKYTPQPI